MARDKPRWTFAVAGFLGAGLLRLLHATWRVRGGESRRLILARRAERAGRPGTIYVQWHSRIMLSAATHSRCGLNVLVSRHGDGEYIVRAIEWMGYGTIRGSTTRGGARALLEMVRVLGEGRDLAMTPDGPKGPRLRVQQGCVVAAMKFPLLAGSSLPVTWRMPAIDVPLGAEVEEMLSVSQGPIDIYDFHALEMIQCMAERRAGGETGVVSMQALRGDAVWRAMDATSWADGGWSPSLFEACLSRSHTLAQDTTLSHRYPTRDQMRAWVKDPIAYRFEYADGLKATMLLMNELNADFTFAAKLKGQATPLSTQFHLPPSPNVAYSAALMSHAESMFLSGRAPYPVERTLLTSGLVAAGMKSLASGQVRIETPHLNVRYAPSRESTFWRE